MRSLLALLFVAGCAPEPMPLPSEEAAVVDRSAEPPLYRRLYDYAFLPEVQEREQRVRILIWLRHMEFTRYQLGLLSELAARTAREREQVEAVATGMVSEQEPAVAAVYDQLWEGMLAGASDEQLATIGEGLEAVRVRETDLLELRARSVRALIEAQQPFLRTLTPRQEALFADATFLLRHRLDPYANPGDFRALIGTIYYAGDFGTLTKPTFDPNEDHLNIGGLWSEAPDELAGPHFPDARREVVLYMVLLEPALPTAIEAAAKLRAASGAAEPGAPGATFGAGAGGVPADGAAPGTPTEPAPAPPGEPIPAPAGAPGGAADGARAPGLPMAPAPGTPTPPAPARGTPAPGTPTPPAPGTPTPPAPVAPAAPKPG
jgi:hypothetical protein